MSTVALYVLMVSGDHENVQMAGMLASVAAVSERPVTVFVSMNAMFAFRKDRQGTLPGGEFSSVMKGKNVPDAVTLFQQGKELGNLTVFPCSMAMDVTGWRESELVDGLFEPPAGLTRFLADAESGQLVVI